MSEPIHIISLGAGVQSSTMALMAAHGEITPMPEYAIFADTQDEPDSVYQWLDWLEQQLPYPVNRVTNGRLSDSVTEMRLTKDGRRFSKTNVPFFTRNADGQQGKIKHRSCTYDFKIRPIVKQVRLALGSTLKEWRREHRDDLRVYNKWLRHAKKAQLPFPHAEYDRMQANALVMQWIGISTDEASRMKPSREPWIKSRWPLIELRMKRQDCLEWMLEHEYPKPPRSSCVYCPYHNDHEWRRLRDDEPVEFQRAVEFEIAVQKAKAQSDNFTTVPYLHRSLVALEAVDLSTAEERGQGNLFINECEGVCGV